MKIIRNLTIGAVVAVSVAAFSMPSQAQVVKAGQTAPLTPGGLDFPSIVMAAVAKDAGLQVEFVNIPLADLQQALLDKKIDIISSTYSPTVVERRQIVDFTQSWGTLRDALVVPVGDTKTYTSIADLKGVKVGATKGSAFAAAAQQAGANVTLVDTTDLWVPMVEDGRVAAAIGNEPIEKALLGDQHPKLKIVDSYAPALVQDMAFAVRKGDDALLTKLNLSLTKLKADGTIKAIAIKTGFTP